MKERPGVRADRATLCGILSSIKSMVRTLASILSFGLVSGLMATHIIGGEIYYAHLGGDQYLFT